MVDKLNNQEQEEYLRQLEREQAEELKKGKKLTHQIIVPEPVSDE